MGNNETTPKMVSQVEAVFPLAGVSATTDSVRQYLDPTEGTQAVQLLQDGTSIRATARRFAVSLSTVSRA